MLEAGKLVREDRWLLIVFALVAGALCLGGYQFYRVQRADVVATRQAELGAIASLKAGQIAGWRAERVADARGLAEDMFLADALARWLAEPADSATSTAIVMRLTQVRDIFGYQNVLLAAADGRLLLSLDARVSALETPTRRLVEEATAARDAVFGELFSGPVPANAMSLDVAAPIVDRQQRVIAVVVLRVMAEQRLYPLLGSWPTPSGTAETILGRRGDDDVVYLNPLRHPSAAALDMREPLSSPGQVGTMAARGRVGSVRGRDYRGVEVLADLRPIPGSEWLMVAKVDVSEILAEARYRAGTILGVTAIAIVSLAMLLAAVAAFRRKNFYAALFSAERQRANLLEEYRATLHGIGDGVLTTDAAGNVRRMNPMAEKLTGWSAALAEGRPVEEVFAIVNEETRATVESPVLRVLREGCIAELAHHSLLVALDGAERPIADSAAPISSAQGELVGAVLVFRDQSAERASERALRESEARYRMLFVANPRPMWVYDTETLRFLAVNDAAVDAYGWSREEFLTMTIVDIRPPEDAPSLLAEVGRLGDHAFRRRRLWTHLTRDGARIDVEITSHALLFDGRPARLILVHDVTDQLRAERALHDSERFLRSVLDAVPTHLAIIDSSGLIMAVNQSWRRFASENSGQPTALCEGANYLSACDRATGDGADRAWAFAAGIRAVLAGECATFELEYPCHSERERRWFVGQVNRFGGDGPVRVVISHVDITELRNVNDELDRHRLHLEELVDKRTAQLSVAMHRAEAANQAKSAFLANMSHEIRTPMNGVLGMVEVLAQSRLSARQAEIVRTISDSGTTLLRLLDEILDFSKIEAERLELEYIPIDVAEIVEGLGDALVPGALRTDVDLSVFVSPRVPGWVMGDALRVRQVLYNLIGNAIKFSAGHADHRGRVRVRVDITATTPRRLHFTISDNGEGMSEEVLGRLFVPFTQGEVATTRRFGGTGLGLAISKRLVDLMGGALDVSSVRGSGSTFSVMLPLEPAPDQPTGMLQDLSGVNCVVVENDDIDVDGLGEYLLHAGARVLRAASLEQANAAATDCEGPTVVVHRAVADPEVRERGTPLLAGVHVLLITRGRRRQPRIERSGVVSLDAGGIRRASVLRAVALAAGRLVPEPMPDAVESTRIDPDKRMSTAVRPDEPGRRILVAEDDEVNRKVIAEQLNLLGYTFRIAPDGVRALAMWGEGGDALLITDLHMREMDGYMLTEAIRSEEARRAEAGSIVVRTPIVALTANAMRGEAERAKSLGADEYLTKPVQLARLQEVLQRILPAPAAASAPVRTEGIAALSATDSGQRAGVETQPGRSVDLNVLGALVGRDPRVLHGLLEGYLEALCQLGPQLLAACDSGDSTVAASIAHRLKSSSRSVGALALCELCADIETEGFVGMSASRVRRHALAGELVRVEAEIRAALDARQ